MWFDLFPVSWPIVVFFSSSADNLVCLIHENFRAVKFEQLAGTHLVICSVPDQDTLHKITQNTLDTHPHPALALSSRDMTRRQYLARTTNTTKYTRLKN